MNDQLRPEGDDQFFHSREIFENHNTIQVPTVREASEFVDSYEFSAIVARDCDCATTTPATDNISSVTV